MARAWVREPREWYGVDGDALLDADDVGVHLADVAHVVEDEGLDGTEKKGNTSLGSNPQAMMSFALSMHICRHSSSVSFFHRNFSSSVSWITRGQWNTSCSHLVKKKGIRCPRCRLPEEGPLPV